MDPDAEVEQATSKILTPTFITVVFTACNYYKTETTPAVSTIQFSLPDSTAKTVAPVIPKKKKQKTIYLTFDDGPNRGTKKMMHIVEEEQVPVTLFIVGEHVYGSREQTATFDSLMACKYFEIANHSFTHAQNKYAKFYMLPDSAVKDFMRCADSLHLTANIVRTPGRNIWRTANISFTDIEASSATADSIYKDGFTEVGWDVEWHYDENLKLTRNSDQMLALVDTIFARGKTRTPDNLVLLAHDQVYEDAADSAELHQFIIKLKAKDEYNFETVSKYPGLKDVKRE